MLAAWNREHIAKRAGSGAAQRSARKAQKFTAFVFNPRATSVALIS